MLSFSETVTLEDDERLVGVYREHAYRLFFIVLPHLFAAFLLFLFLFPLFYLGKWGVGFFFLFLCIDTLWGMRRAIKWYGSIFLLTSRRCILIVRKGFFHKEVQDILLTRIADVMYRKKGFFSLLFSVGTLTVTTKDGSTTQHILKRLPHPERVKDAIMREVTSILSAQVLEEKNEDLSPEEIKHLNNATFRRFCIKIERT